MGRSVAQQAADNRRRRATGQPTVPISYDSGPPNPAERPTLGYGQPAQPTAGTGAPAPVQGRIPGGGSATTPWTPTDKPGYGETYWEQNGGQWNQPGASTNYWNGIAGTFANPTAYENNVGGYANTLGNTRGALENLYDQYSGSGEFTKPGAGEAWFAQNGGQYGAPSAGESALGNLLPQYGQSGASEDYAKRFGGFYANEGAMEDFARQNTDRLTGTGELKYHGNLIAADINNARNTGVFHTDNLGQFEAPSFTENLAYGYDPSQRTYNEDFLLGGGATSGLDSLYDRLYSKGSQRLSNEGAARGGFNSGASLRAAEELGADLDAQHVRDYMSASNAADASRSARDNYGLNLMQGADSSMLGRLGLGLQSAQASDNMALSRAGAAQDLYSGITGEELSRLGLAGNWAQNSQSDALARMLGGAGVANQANNAWLARLQGQGNVASDMATQWLNRLNSGGTAASRAQSDQLNRIGAGIGAAGAAQGAWQGRIGAAAGLDQNAQAMMWDRIMNGGTLANYASNEELQRLTGGFNAANAAEASKQNRQGNTFDNLYRSGSGQATAYGNYQDKARDEERDAVMNEINGLIAQGGITSQEIMAKYGSRMAALGLVIQGGKIVAGAMTGNPGLMASGGSKTYDPDAPLPLGYTG